MKFETFDSRLSQMLRAMPATTIAELTDGMIAWWNGARVVYAWVGDEALEKAHHTARELDLADDWGQFHDWLAAWIDEPRFSMRLEPLGRERDTA
ncbi:hypothetical protein ACFQ3P_01825 [Paraburkholderia sabiae]|jgi:hypothetical protein|uniref:Uncharacterized protein n=1 Tax=Paraburkholderia sabiae TaxID=273251 RepID=A0ABU9Q9M4_9BURK|nr:hypothetical protein [Paraburkholderia sabiae]WJZ78618.1 hypothetical protein QEN71_32040 [Paraburkholderia sabiae]CAD6510532.1 hypothetical protein LMG24235_00365 [Paraburkholderia sabiae]CAG9206816.1 conserved hypothetical protein [Paraburkholderia sabiae]